jgi:hypothetical protein
VPIAAKLAKGLAKLRGTPREVKFVGKSQYLYVRLERKDPGKEGRKWSHYLIFRRDTAAKVFSFQNSDPTEASGFQELDEAARGLRVLGMLACEKVRKRTEKRRNMRLGDAHYEYGSEDEHDEETASDEEDDYDGEVDSEKEGDSEKEAEEGQGAEEGEEEREEEHDGPEEDAGGSEQYSGGEQEDTPLTDLDLVFFYVTEP